MDIQDIAVPEVYKESSDFRFFLKWISECFNKTKYDTENFLDLYDPLRCPEELIWALADTMGYKFDSRLPSSFNRLVLVYFMSMIRNRGSRDGVTLAAETNLAQFRIFMNAAGYTNEDDEEIPGKQILYNRLEDTSIPVNSVYVTPNTESGFIDVVYYSTKIPTDACIEYVRPLGMFLFQHAGVDFQSRTKISIDARLTDSRDKVGLSGNFGPTQVGHYTRYDYASLQRSSTYTEPKVPMWPNWERNDTASQSKYIYIPESDNNGNFDIQLSSIAYPEKVYTELDVTPNVEYTVSFKYKVDNADVMNSGGDFHMYVAPIDSNLTTTYSHIEHLNTPEIIRLNSTQWTNCKFKFTSDESKVFLILDWGSMQDGQMSVVHFSPVIVYREKEIGEGDIIGLYPIQMENDASHIRDRVWARNSEYEQDPAPREDINPGYRSLYSLQLANNEQVVKSLIDPVFSLGYGPQEIGVTYPDDYLKYPYIDKYKTGRVFDYRNLSKLSNWHRNFPDGPYPDRWTFTYEKDSNMNSASLITAPGWERVYIKQPVSKNATYRLSLDFFNFGNVGGGQILPVYVCPTSSLDDITTLYNLSYLNINKFSGKVDGVSGKDYIPLSGKQMSSSETHTFEFDTGNNSEVYIVIDGGGLSDLCMDRMLTDLGDNTPYKLNIGNIRFGQLVDTVNKPYNLRYDRALEESIRADKVVSHPTSEVDVYTVEDREKASTIIRPIPAVNPIMSQMGDAISLNPDDPNKPNSKYTVTKELEQKDIHVEEVDTDD